MRIETTDQFPAELDEIARRSPEATFYQTSVWIESLSRSFPALGLRCMIASEGGETLGYLPFFVMERRMARVHWSLPFGTYGGPVTPENGEVGRLLTESFLATRRQSGVHEIGLVDFHNKIADPSLASEEALTHVLDLGSGFDEIWAHRFDKSKRRQTRKARREGIEVTESRSTEDVREYYGIYEARSREWQQRLKYPESLFVRLVEKGQGSVKLFLARSGERLLGGHLNFYFGDTVIAWNGVTTPDSRGVQASTLLYSRCIRHACESGFRRYNLGASLGKRSLVLYKESLGGIPHVYRVLRWRSFGGKIVAAVRGRLPGR